ncbi:type II toxin-antitoxin system PemK/MazF family toxin [Candidatus Thiodictyon syntrophicum]|uniref:MazF family transcriptional regulator n=1 Tax=Candidatus Thiodictyon syntrophicum TaxID=1166950 RepID=A0A2K8U862_9GAMM|nr:type II toxin-antitoxin system PemK/MazF family toxin [Candidatus Thiodictyon syntrophicum]AUB81766.1 MazF family transcriptional regulator [Candidatus Thiodictyon syntrophicum]
MERLIRGGIHLARLDPAKGAEIGKLRPVALLSAPEILEIDSPLLFVCPLSSRSEPRYASLHVPLSPRDDLKAESFALVEHCRAISRTRLCGPPIARLTESEIEVVLHRLMRLVGL